MKRGFTLVEILVVIAMLIIVMAFIFPMVGWLITKSASVRENVQAATLLQEGLEVGYAVLQVNWHIAPLTYHPAIETDIDGTQHWILQPGSAPAGGKFTRQVEIVEVCRNNSDGKLRADITIANCHGSTYFVDPATRIVKSKVTWSGSQVNSALMVLSL